MLSSVFQEYSFIVATPKITGNQVKSYNVRVDEGWVRARRNCLRGILACENIRFSKLFAAPLCETSPAAKSEEKRMFSQAMQNAEELL